MINLAVERVEEAGHAEDVARVAQFPVAGGVFAHGVEVGGFLRRRTRLLRHLERGNVVILEVMLQPLDLVDGREEPRRLVLRGLADEKRRGGDALLVRLLAQDVDDGVALVLRLVIVVQNPGSVGAGEVRHDHDAEEDGHPDRALSGKSSAHHQDHQHHRDGQEEKEESHFLRAVAGDGEGHAGVGKARVGEMLDHVALHRRVGEIAEEACGAEGEAAIHPAAFDGQSLAQPGFDPAPTDVLGSDFF